MCKSAIVSLVPNNILSAAAYDPASRKRLFWYLQALGWTGMGLITVFFMSSGFTPWQTGAFLAVYRTVFALVVTSLVHPLFHRLRSYPKLAVKIGLVLVFCAVAGFADAKSTQFLAKLIGSDLEAPTAQLFLFASPILRFVVFSLWCVLYFGISYWLDTQKALLQATQAEAYARESELRLLREQVNPHFLFNALNSILADADNPVRVRAVVLALAKYLRFSFQQNADIEPLGVELEALDNYLQVEKARFEEKLEYCIEADKDARSTPAPVALVQPLLENAIKYGQRSETRPLRLSIEAKVSAGQLQIRVCNTGAWIEPGTHDSTGTGLANLRRRLALLYQGAATLKTHPGENEVAVCVSLPIQDKEAKP